MATNVIMPVLGVAQDSGKIVRWHKHEGDAIQKGEPLLEVETDKAVVDIEAPAGGVLGKILAMEGQDVPVTQVIGVILAVGESGASLNSAQAEKSVPAAPPAQTSPAAAAPGAVEPAAPKGAQAVVYPASPLATSIAAENGVDLSLIKPKSARIEKADVLSYIESLKLAPAAPRSAGQVLASPKARRLAAESGVNLAEVSGSGPDGAVLANDVIAAPSKGSLAGKTPVQTAAVPPEAGESQAVSTVWRIMAEHTTQSWTTTPHFFLMREVDASRLISWRERLLKHAAEKITYTDLLVKIVAFALKKHPAVNSAWNNGSLLRLPHVNVSLAVAQDGGLVVPVIHDADCLSIGQIAQQRVALVEKARAGRLRPEDISGGTFTISNLGMYGIDAFNAILNGPQAGILAVGRIAERVVAVDGAPAVRPTMVLSLSGDHRVLDGARGAQFLELVADLVEEPAGLVE